MLLYNSGTGVLFIVGSFKVQPPGPPSQYKKAVAAFEINYIL